jgi:Bifunctional DNA primase/polymerase, N-terminal/AAA domain
VTGENTADRTYSALDLALSLAGSGLHVFPLCGKTPPPGFKWKDRASSDPQAVVAEFAGLPESVGNVGIACGPSGLLVVDEDEPDAFTKACADAGEQVPNTYKVSTGSPGRCHWYFTTEDRELGNRVGRFTGRHIDIRGQGGYVVAAGSTHPDTGAVYTPVNGSDIAPLPGWIREWLTTEPEDQEAGPRRPRFVLPDRIKGGSRHNVIVSYAASLRAQEITLDEAMAAVTGAWKRCEQPPAARSLFPLGEALQTVRDVYRRYKGGRSTDGGHGRHQDDPGPSESGERTRRIKLTPASQIRLRRVRWLWNGRLPLGHLVLIAGPEGLGKSTVALQIAADVTRGRLDGEFAGEPRAVLVVATEDSWGETIAGRLVAAGADLDLVFRVEAQTAGDLATGVDLHVDLGALEAAIGQTGAVLLLLDPLLSRLGRDLDSHKDSDVRISLEPLASMLDRTKASAVGIMHLNKSLAGAILDRVMASKAFTAVARSVCVVIPDPADKARRLFGTPKNNLGRSDLPTLSFTVTEVEVDTEDGPSSVGRVEWGAPVALTIQEAMDELAGGPGMTELVSEAVEWLTDLMEGEGGRAWSSDVKMAARKAGIAEKPLRTARVRLGIRTRNEGFPRRTVWQMPTEGGHDE